MKPLGKIAPESAAVQEALMMDYGQLGGKPVEKDANAVTPAERTLPPQGEPTQVASEATKGFYIYKGFRGVPFRSRSGKAPDIKANDTKKPVITADAQAGVFDLSDSKDLQEYIRIWDQASKGIYMISAEERQWVPEAKNWKVFLRWGVQYWEFPEE